MFKFFSVLRSLQQGFFRKGHKISHNTQGKIWRQLCDVIFPVKNVKIGKTKIMKFYRMTSSIFLRNFMVVALKLNLLFAIWISRHFVTKNNLRGITMGIGPIWESSSITLHPLLHQHIIVICISYLKVFMIFGNYYLENCLKHHPPSV